ncbi:MAG: Stk1 family PASTA domain-containing Ser/Thr kinase [Lachnospiraceae bacterium]|nr:Stk1 family PASTA domain-containing Ser/Thr kinase [Lachnospiraceae bacterium]
MLNIGDILDERYEIESKVGQGGMSTVYKARDLKLGREVAIKLLKEEFSADEEFIERFKNEARSAARLSHTNIVATFDIVNNEERHYIVMELVEGITLKDYIARKGRLSNKETIGIALQTAEGLSEAHKNSIIHRDIKSQNIIISKEGRIKIADFGIARAVTGDTLGKSVIGSAHYISPEQAKTGESDARSDLYSLGICMYEMITGRLPYQGENTVNVVMAHIQDAMVPPNVYNNEIYPALNDIILKATRKEPEERYQSAEDLIEDLRHAVSEPDGHYVRFFDSIGSGQLAENQHLQDRAAAKKADQGLQAPAAGSGDGDSDEDEEDLTGLYDDSRTRFAILGITAAILVVVALIGMFLFRNRTNHSGPAETNVQAQTSASESQTETEEMNYTLSIKGEDVMPDLTGMTVDEARAKLASIQMSMDSSTTDYSDIYPKDTIIKQSPNSGEVLTSDSTVYVTVSLGPKADYVLSNLKNMTAEDARAALEDAGVRVSDEPAREFADDVAENLVIGFKEMGFAEDGARVVALIVSYGRQDDYVVMPDITGSTREEAVTLLTANQLSLGNALAINSEEAEPEEIVSQSVPADTFVKKGSPIDIQVCVGSDGRIPDGTILTTDIQISTSSGTGSSDVLSDEYFYGSIDTSCVIGEQAGPGAASSIYIAVRLMQRVEDSIEYTMLSEPIPVAPGTRIPVSYKNIRGAFGVPEGTVEVYGVDNEKIYSSYVIGFVPADQM